MSQHYLREQQAMPIAFERATEIVARQLASFRLGMDCADPYAYTEHEELCAGHIVGALWAQDLLNTAGEDWIPVKTENRDDHGHELPLEDAGPKA
jgi:hypothetical protein